MRISRALFALAAAASLLAARTANVTVLATADMHGNLLAWDYFAAKAADRGLSKIATLIREQRAGNPNAVLIDCGDTIQGAPLEAVYQYYVKHGSLPLGQAAPGPLDGDPMMRAMNALGYDAMTLGNHEFNFGLRNIADARRIARFPWLSANTRSLPGSGNQPFAPYMVKTVGGVKVAVVGVTTTGIPSWEEPANWKGYEFLPAPQAAAAAVADVRAKHHPDIVVVAAHMGLGADLSTGNPAPGDLAGENMVYEIAKKVPGVDAIVFGHTHNQLPEARVGDVLLVQPKNWAMSLARIDFTLDDSAGRWTIASKHSRLIPVTREIQEDPQIVALAAPYHKAAEQYLNAPVARSEADLATNTARVEDNALIDAIQAVQMHYAKADVSMTAAFNVRVRVPKGPVTVREIAALYLYDNTLFAVDGTGRMLRDALENAARFYLQCEGDCSRGPLVNRKMVGFNYDIAQGVEYEIDIREPEGRRIKNLRWRGKPLADDQKLRLAINNYRYGGSGGYGMFRAAPVLWRSPQEIRELIIEYYTERKVLPAAPDGNWRVVPEAARAELIRESRGAAESNQ